MSDIVVVALVTGSVSIICMIVPLIFNQRSSRSKKIDSICTDVQQLKTQQDEMSDIVYQMLDHMATNNNTGNMKRCLEAYVKFNIHH